MYHIEKVNVSGAFLLFFDEMCDNFEKADHRKNDYVYGYLLSWLQGYIEGLPLLGRG